MRAWLPAALTGVGIACLAAASGIATDGRAAAPRATQLDYDGATAVQTTDHLAVQAHLRDAASRAPIAGRTIVFTLGPDSVSLSTDGAGTARGDLPISAQPSSATLAVSFAGDADAGPSSTSAPISVSREDAELRYSGALEAPSPTALPLEVTVLDSAAAGYAGPRPEPSGTPGDVTRVAVRFSVYHSDECGGKKLLASVIAPVVDSRPAGDGIGTATASFTPPAPDVYCAMAQLVAPDGSQNAWYAGDEAIPVGLASYAPEADGWTHGAGRVTDASGGTATVTIFARTVAKPRPAIYSYRDAYLDRTADYVVACNNLKAHVLLDPTYPRRVRMRGGCLAVILDPRTGSQLDRIPGGDGFVEAFDGGPGGTDTILFQLDTVDYDPDVTLHPGSVEITPP
jgi:hypothetical protein